MLVHTVMASPLGKLKLVANDHGLVAVALPGQDAKDESIAVRSHAVLDQAARELSEYFAGKRHRFTIKLELRGTPFQKHVWRALARIPFGRRRSYGELAHAIGKPGAARAVGRANATNPIAILLPCHRVVGADGSLTGYAGGVAAKRWLLDHEESVGALCSHASAPCPTRVRTTAASAGVTRRDRRLASPPVTRLAPAPERPAKPARS